MEQEQPTEQTAAAELQVCDTDNMTIAQWERVKAQYQAAGYQYAGGLVVFRRVTAQQQAPLSIVPEEQSR